MADACHIFGDVFKTGGATLLARIVGADGSPINRASLSDDDDAITYTVYELDDDAPDTETAVTGHAAVAIAKTSAIFDSLQTDDLWGDTDTTGYNFRHAIDISTYAAFARRGATYLVRVWFAPATGQKILAAFWLPAK